MNILKSSHQVQADAEVAGRARCSVHRGAKQHRHQLQEEQVGRIVHLRDWVTRLIFFFRVYTISSVLLVHAPLAF